MSEYNVNESIKAQEKLCIEKGLPHFAPSSGVCWTCHKNIYKPIERQGYSGVWVSGITTEKAATKLVTGCPHCNRTYCD